MRVLLSLITLCFAVAIVPAQQHDEWTLVRSVEDGFSIEMPGTPKISTSDLGKGGTQKNYTFEIGQETFMVSVIHLAAGGVPTVPDETYFGILMKAYVDGSSTTLRSSRMFRWAGRPAMEGIADASGGTHLVDLTTSGDYIYMAVYAAAKGRESTPRATHMRDSFKLLGK